MNFQKTIPFKISFFRKTRLCHFLRIFVVCTLLYSTLIPSEILAQVGSLTGANTLNLPVPGVMVKPTIGFNPTLLVGLKVYPDNPFRFDFIVDTGEDKLQGEELKAESTKLIKYFLTSLTVPEDELWVNLSPYEKDRIIPEKFGITEMGKDLLAQDYLLKQLTASLIYPEDELGKSFWDKIYQKAYELYGTTNIPINTFNKVWIIPDNAVVYENKDVAFVVESHLKVMLEGDYLALQNNLNKEEIGTDKLEDKDVRQLSDVSSQIVRDVILPAIEKEVNEGKNFAQLRQIYSGLILAAWYKKRLKESILAKVYADKNKVAGVDVEDKEIKDKIYDQYVEAFKQGVYNYIKEDDDPFMGKMVKRRYVSGGFTAQNFAEDNLKVFDEAEVAKSAPLKQKIFDGFRKIINPIMIVGAALLLPNTAAAQDRPPSPSAIIQNTINQPQVSNISVGNDSVQVRNLPATRFFRELVQEHFQLINSQEYQSRHIVHQEDLMSIAHKKEVQLLLEIGKTKHVEAVAFLKNRYLREVSDVIKQAIAGALAETQRIEAIPVLVSILEKELEGNVYGHTYDRLINFKAPSSALSHILGLYQKAFREEKEQGYGYYTSVFASMIGNIETPEAVQAVENIISKTQDMDVRVLAINALGRNESPQALSVLIKSINIHPNLHYRVMQALTSAILKQAELTGSTNAFSAIDSLITNVPESRADIFSGLGAMVGIHAHHAVDVLSKNYYNVSGSERVDIIQGLTNLGNIGVKGAVPRLLEIIDKDDLNVGEIVLDYLAQDYYQPNYTIIPVLDVLTKKYSYDYSDNEKFTKSRLMDTIYKILGKIKHPASVELLIKCHAERERGGTLDSWGILLESLGRTQQQEARKFLVSYYDGHSLEAVIPALALTGLKEARDDLLRIYYNSQDEEVRTAVVTDLEKLYVDSSQELSAVLIKLYVDSIEESQLTLGQKWKKYSLWDFLFPLPKYEHVDIREKIVVKLIGLRLPVQDLNAFDNILRREISWKTAKMAIDLVHSDTVLLGIIDEPQRFAFMKDIEPGLYQEIISAVFNQILELVDAGYFKSQEKDQKLMARLNSFIHTVENQDGLGKVMDNVSKYAAKDNTRKEITKVISDIYLSLLSQPDTFVFWNSNQISLNIKNKFQEAAGHSLINLLIFGKLNNEQTSIVLEFARQKSDLGRFLSYSLILNESKAKDETLKRSIQDLKKMVFPESFDYEHFLEDGKLVFRFYFLSNEFYNSPTRNVDPARNQVGSWKYWLTQNFGEGETVKLLGKEFTRFKKMEKLKDGRQITVYIDISHVPDKGTDFKERTFELIGNPETDFVGYFGHTGGGVNLAMSFDSAPTNEFAILNPVGIILSDCSSGPSYENKLYQLYPNAQTIVTAQMTYEPDSPRIFNELFKGMLNLETHRELNKRLKKFDWEKESVSKNYTFPDDANKLRWRDSDGDGAQDSEDTVYNLIERDTLVTFDDFQFRPTSEAPKQSLFELMNYIEYRFSPNSFLKHFINISFPQESEDDFSIKGWYRDRLDRTNLLKISATTTETDTLSFQIEFNTGYSQASLRPLKMATTYELVDYFTRHYEVKGDKLIERETPLEKMSPVQNFWAFMKAVEVLSLELHAAGGEEKRSHLESIYNKFVEKYNLLREVNFDTADKAYWSKPLAETVKTPETDEALEIVKVAFGVGGELRLISSNQRSMAPLDAEFWIAEVNPEDSKTANKADQIGGFENAQMATHTPQLISRQGLQLKDTEVHITRSDSPSSTRSDISSNQSPFHHNDSSKERVHGPNVGNDYLESNVDFDNQSQTTQQQQSQEKITDPEINRITNMLLSTTSSMTKLPVESLSRIDRSPAIDALFSQYESLILNKLSSEQIRTLPLASSIYQNYYFSYVQYKLFNMMVNIAKVKGEEIASNFVTQASRALELELGSGGISTTTLKGYGRFYQDILNLAGSNPSLLSVENKGLVNNMRDALMDVVKQQEGETEARDVSVEDAMQIMEKSVANHLKLLEGEKVPFEKLGEWKEIEFYNPLTGKTTKLMQARAYSDGQRLIMGIADRLFKKLVVEKGLQDEWFETVKSGIISQNHHEANKLYGRKTEFTDEEIKEVARLEARYIFSESYQSLVLSGNITDTHWYGDGGYDLSEEIPGIRKFFDDHNILTNLPHKATIQDLIQIAKRLQINFEIQKKEQSPSDTSKSLQDPQGSLYLNKLEGQMFAGPIVGDDYSKSNLLGNDEQKSQQVKQQNPGQRSVFLLPHSHTHPLIIEEIEKTIYDVNGIEGGKDSKESRQYRDKIEGLLRQHQNQINAYKIDLNEIGILLSNPQNKITAIGVEATEEELTRIKNEARRDLIVLIDVMRMRGVENFEKKAEDVFLLLSGTESYMLAKQDTLLSGKVELVALEKEQDRAEAFSFIEKFQQLKLQLIDVSQKKGIAFKTFDQWIKFNEKFLDENRIPNVAEIEEAVKGLEYPEAIALAREGVQLHINFLKSSAKRDETIVNNIVSQGGNILIIVERNHYEGIKQKLEDNKGIKIKLSLQNQQKEEPSKGKKFENGAQNFEMPNDTQISSSLADRASVEEQRNPGGIDFNPTNLDLQIKGEGMDFNLFYDCPEGTVQFNAAKCTPRNSEQLQNLPIPGLYPVIFSVVPVPNLLPLLGLDTNQLTSEQERAAL